MKLLQWVQQKFDAAKKTDLHTPETLKQAAISEVSMRVYGLVEKKDAPRSPALIHTFEEIGMVDPFPIEKFHLGKGKAGAKLSAEAAAKAAGKS